jgi:hypothetical protein
VVLLRGGGGGAAHSWRQAERRHEIFFWHSGIHAGRLLLLARVLAGQHPHAGKTGAWRQVRLGNASAATHVVRHAAHEARIHAHAHGISGHTGRWRAWHAAAGPRHVLAGMRHPVAVIHAHAVWRHAAHRHAWMLLISNLLLRWVLLLLHGSRL